MLTTDTFTRDTSSSALLNKDVQGATAYKLRRQKSARIQMVEDQINSMAEEMKSIKEMLTSFINQFTDNKTTT